MPLADGDQAEDGDVWFRIATQPGHIKQGRVHHSAFSGRAISSPTTNRPWSRELSGRLYSLAGTLDEIEKHAVAYCAAGGGQKKEFVGVMYVKAEDARKAFENYFTTDVNYTPIAGVDLAHADFTFSDWPNPDFDEQALERFRLWFSKMLMALHTPQVKLLPLEFKAN